MPWKKGQSGNPKGGKVSNARRLLSDQFLRDLGREWKKRGTKAITDVAEDDPGTFLRVVASLLPKEIHQDINVKDERTENEIVESILAKAKSLDMDVMTAIQERLVETKKGNEVTH